MWGFSPALGCFFPAFSDGISAAPSTEPAPESRHPPAQSILKTSACPHSASPETADLALRRLREAASWDLWERQNSREAPVDHSHPQQPHYPHSQHRRRVPADPPPVSSPIAQTVFPSARSADTPFCEFRWCNPPPGLCALSARRCTSRPHAIPAW